MDKVIDLIASMVSPGKTWGCFFRKTLSTLLVACIGAYGFNQYKNMSRSHWEDLPLDTAIEKGNIKGEVQKYLDGLVRHDQNLHSVWVYSWPDARTLEPVAHSGHYVDPMPLGYFQVRDASAIGQMVMEQCTEIERRQQTLTACPIMAENDAWGVVIFECEDDGQRPDRWRSVYAALTHKLSHIIYNDV